MTQLSSWTCRSEAVQHLVGGGVHTSSSKERSPAAVRQGSLAGAGPEALALPETDFGFDDELAETDLEDEPLLAEELRADESVGRAGGSTSHTATTIGKRMLQL